MTESVETSEAGVNVVKEIGALELPAAIEVIARGMRDNPLHIAAFGPDVNMRGISLTRMFTLGLPMILARGVVLGAFRGDTLVGVAGMVSPGRCQPSLTDRLALMPRLIPAVGTGAFTRVGRWLGTWARLDLAEPHWHLGPVAVDAHLQGRGIGSRLMMEYCARLDRAREVGYLETDKRGNVAFYEKFGFETVAEASVLNTPNWFMRRAAR